jgi:glycerol dehydrogenase-like iron-containing ADH family enzyme
VHWLGLYVAADACRPDKKDKEAAFAEFAASLDDQLKQQAAEEDDEAEAAAREREERETYEQQ